ncbi:MAG: hypothetical protein IJ491_06660 [Clostridia bacterium]|nr:hypothetical protein [Clostridia bacterium]
MDFSDFNFDCVNDILSTLSEKDVENLSEIASQFFSSQNAEKEQKDTAGQQEQKKKSGNGFPFDDMPFDKESMMKIFNLMNKLKNQPEDQRVKLLYALRPMLTEKRRHKVDEAVQMLRIMAILPLLRE